MNKVILAVSIQSAVGQRPAERRAGPCPSLADCSRSENAPASGLPATSPFGFRNREDIRGRLNGYGLAASMQFNHGWTRINTDLPGDFAPVGSRRDTHQTELRTRPAKAGFRALNPCPSVFIRGFRMNCSGLARIFPNAATAIEGAGTRRKHWARGVGLDLGPCPRIQYVLRSVFRGTHQGAALHGTKIGAKRHEVDRYQHTHLADAATVCANSPCLLTVLGTIRAKLKTAWRFCLSPHDLDGAAHRSTERRQTPANTAESMPLMTHFVPFRDDFSRRPARWRAPERGFDRHWARASALAYTNGFHIRSIRCVRGNHLVAAPVPRWEECGLGSVANGAGDGRMDRVRRATKTAAPVRDWNSPSAVTAR